MTTPSFYVRRLNCNQTGSASGHILVEVTLTKNPPLLVGFLVEKSVARFVLNKVGGLISPDLIGKRTGGAQLGLGRLYLLFSVAMPTPLKQ